MTAQVSWLVENHIILWYDKGPTSVEGIKQGEAEVIRMFEQSPAALVHIVFDMQAVIEMPSLAENIRAKFQFPTYPKCGWSILIGIKDPIQKMIVSILGGVFKARMRLVLSKLAALEFLEMVDANLPALTAHKERATSKV